MRGDSDSLEIQPPVSRGVLWSTTSFWKITDPGGKDFKQLTPESLEVMAEINALRLEQLRRVQVVHKSGLNRIYICYEAGEGVWREEKGSLWIHEVTSFSRRPEDQSRTEWREVAPTSQVEVVEESDYLEGVSE